MEFTDGDNVSIDVGSVGRPLNAIGSDSLSSGGPVETPADPGRSTSLDLSGQEIPGGTSTFKSPCDD